LLSAFSTSPIQLSKAVLTGLTERPAMKRTNPSGVSARRIP
jgi:hypothetical protein